jgi:tape measure domain-containing protein
MDAAARLMPSIAAAIASGDAGQVEQAMSGLMTFISTLAADFGSLTPEAQAAVNSMIAAFDLAPLSENSRLAMMNVKIEMLGLLPEVEQLLKDRGAAMMELLFNGLLSGSLNGDDYNAILGAASSKTALEQLRAQFVKDAKDAAVGLVDGFLSQIAQVEEAARLLKEAATPEAPETEAVGTASAEQITSAITAEVPNTEAAASGLGKAAMDSLRKALEDGSISADTYNSIILANSTGTLTDLATKFREASKTSIAGFIEELLSKSEEIVTAAKDVAGDAVVPAIDNTAIGENAASSVATGMNNKLPDVTAAADAIVDQIQRTLKAGLLIRSPSKVGIGIGEFVGEGLAIGMDNMTSRVYASSMSLADRAALGLRGISGDAGLNIDSETNTGDIIQAATRQAVESVLDKLNITLEVDGTQLGRASIKAINDTTRRTGRTLLVTT